MDERLTPTQALAAELGNIVDMLRDKQRQYGVQNVVATGHYGIAVRLVDKAYRLLNIVGFHDAGRTVCFKQPDPGDLREVYRDIAGYALIGLLETDGNYGWFTERISVKAGG